MDLLKTILIYMSMVFVSSVQNAPEMTPPPMLPTETPVAAVVEVTATPTPEPTPTPTPVPTPDITPNSEYKAIRVGDNGEQVTEMQRRLAELGYYAGDIDGRFGNQTRRAVESFQYNNGLSADGIAGKQTLTVLYESEKVVFAPTPTPAVEMADAVTVTPPPETTPSAVRTVAPNEPTPAPTFVPTPTPASAGDAPDQTAATSEPGETVADGAVETGGGTETESPPTAVVPVPMEGYSFVLQGQSEPLAVTMDGAEEAKALEPLLSGEVTVLMPLMKVLESAGVVVIPDITEERVEYAFTILEDLYRLTYNIDAEGKPVALAIYKNKQPQLMENRLAVIYEELLYLPIADVQSITGITCTLDGEQNIYTISIPTGEEQVE